MSMERDALRAAIFIVDRLRERKGFDAAFDACDQGILRDIENEIADIICYNMETLYAVDLGE